jgi:hypothetical protein
LEGTMTDGEKRYALRMEARVSDDRKYRLSKVGEVAPVVVVGRQSEVVVTVDGVDVEDVIELGTDPLLSKRVAVQIAKELVFTGIAVATRAASDALNEDVSVQDVRDALFRDLLGYSLRNEAARCMSKDAWEKFVSQEEKK